MTRDWPGAEQRLVEVSSLRALTGSLRARLSKVAPEHLLAEAETALEVCPVRRLRRSQAGRRALQELWDLLAELSRATGREREAFYYRRAAAELSPSRGRLLASLLTEADGRRFAASDPLLLALGLCSTFPGIPREWARAARTQLLLAARVSGQEDTRTLHLAVRAALSLLMAEGSTEAVVAAARALLARGRPKRALEVLQQWPITHGRHLSGQALFLMAWASWACDDIRGARTALARLAADPRIGGEPAVRLLDLLLKWQPRGGSVGTTQALLQRADEDEILGLQRAVAPEFPQGAAMASFALAERRLAGWRLVEAEEELTRGLQWDPNYGPLRLLLARLMARVGNEASLAQAEVQARMALRLRPLDVNSHLTLLHILGRRLSTPSLERRRRAILARGWMDTPVVALADAMIAVMAGDASRAEGLLDTIAVESWSSEAEASALAGWHLLYRIETRAMHGDYEVDHLIAEALTLPPDCLPPDLPLLAFALARQRGDSGADHRWQRVFGEVPKRDADHALRLGPPDLILGDSRFANESDAPTDPSLHLDPGQPADDLAACRAALASELTADQPAPLPADVLHYARRRRWLFPPLPAI